MCYENLDILKYISSILIILFHINIYKKVVYKIDFIITDVIARLAVPFFYTIAGFLIAQNENKGPNYIKNYLIELFKTYLFWSILYLPLNIPKWRSHLIRQNRATYSNLENHLIQITEPGNPI